MGKQSGNLSKGYKLHRDRFRFSSKEGIRTIKFPLGVWNKKEKKVVLDDNAREFGEKVKKDYESLYGPLNITTYQKDKNLYSVKDFWIDCLKSGVIMMHSNAKMSDVINAYSGNKEKQDKQQKTAMSRTNKEFLAMIDFDKFKQDFILSLPKRLGESVTENSVKNKFIKLSNDKKNQKKLAQYGKDFYKTMTGGDDQEEFLTNNFGVDFSIYKTEDSDEMNYYIFPSIEFNKELKVEKCLERIPNFITEIDSERQISEFIGISDNAGGLSQILNDGFELLKEGNIEELSNKITSSSNIWKGKEKELNDRLKFLSKQANKLDYPSNADSWANYRSEIGGKIQSWVSNTFGKDELIVEQLFNGEIRSHKKDLEKLSKDLERYEDSAGKEKIIEVKESMVNLIDLIEKEWETNKTIDINLLSEYRSLLSDFRSKMNFLFQKHYGISDEEDDVKTKKKQKSVNKEYPALFKELQKTPAFLGEVKIKEKGVYDKYFSSFDRVKEGINLFISFRNIKFKENNNLDEEKSQEKMEQVLQSILSLHKRLNSAPAKQIVEKILRTFVKNIDLDSGNYDYIWRNTKAREKRGKKLELKYLNLVGEKDELLNLLDIKWDKYNNKIFINEWIDFIEIEKIRFGLLAFFYDVSSISFDKNLKKHYVNIDFVSKRFLTIDAHAKNAIVQTAIFSEFKGTVSSMSTNKFISRYIVQVIDSEKKFPIVTENGKYGEQRTKDQKYYINTKASNNFDSEMYKIDKKEIRKGSFKECKVNKNNLLQIVSSTAQLQFLDNTISGLWKDDNPKISSYSFIYEEFHNVTWTDEGPKFISKIDSERLYVSIPFNLGHKKSDQRNTEIVKRDKFLGVDIGEYGIAMYLLGAKDFSKPEFISFIFEPTMRKIREGIKENVERQKAGTFSIPSTKVKRVRDNAITNLRNKIHSVVCKYDARPVYEREVSAFESGSGKISKIYHSIKKSDVYQENSADKLVADLVWGKSSKLIGKNVSAYGTSYICSRCHESIYAHISKEDYETQYKIEDIDKDGILLINLGGIKVKGYSKDIHKKGDIIYGKEVQKFVKAYTRAPIEVVLKRNKDIKKDFDKYIPGKSEKEKIENFSRINGSQAIYTCSFCDSSSDADIQAAMWIALKGYLNMFISTNNEENNYWVDKKIKIGWGEVEGVKNKIKYLANFAKIKKIKPIEFSVKHRVKYIKNIK